MSICHVTLDNDPVKTCIQGTYPTVPEPKSNRCNLEPVDLWMLSWNSAFQQLLIVLLLFLVVRISFDSRAQLNRLTLLPYYFMTAYGVISILQYSWTMYCGFTFDLLGLVNINRQFCLNIAVNTQIFEFRNLYEVI
jgi:hypothetical protein